MHQVDLLMLNKRLSLAPIDKGCQAEKSNVTDRTRTQAGATTGMRSSQWLAPTRLSH